MRMHWIDEVAEELLSRGKKHVVASGISISGHIHIGHSNDVFIADGVRRAIEERGGEVEAIWYADDFDPLRRVPWPLPPSYQRYLGMPYANLPSPERGFEDFVDYFTRDFLASFKDFGLKLKVMRGSEVYRSGEMVPLIRLSLEKAGEIREILNKYRDKPLPEDWLPYDPLCENCGRISTTRAYGWSGDYVKYVCEGCDYVGGCGHEGKADYTKGEGKLTWRVEWPARWKLLGVTCEPFGKDHAVRGGSYETGKEIVEKVFGGKAPYPIPYEWVSLSGKRMSSSKGVVFTLSQWLSIAEPELLRYFIFRSKAMKGKSFDPGLPLLDLYDEYDRVEELYFSKAEEGKRERQLSRIYELSQVERIPTTKPQRVPFRFAVVLSQVVGGREERGLEIMQRKGFLVQPTEEDIQRALGRLRRARRWVEEYAPDWMRFKVLEVLPEEVKGRLTEGQRKGLSRLASDLREREYDPVALHNRVYEVAKEVGADPPELFKAIYLVFIGREEGPRVGNFLSAMEREFVISRLEEASRI